MVQEEMSFKEKVYAWRMACFRQVILHVTSSKDLKVGQFEISWLKTAFIIYDAASGSEITPCNKVDKPLVVYSCSGNVMTSITNLCT